ncbi:MAG: hypothetical protein NTX57_04075 [Armatimonadetes bacterium]|nr:hypothetical protein [Armatimonadota bacterium]
MSQQQLYRPPDLLKDTEADIARWLAQQEPETAVESLHRALEMPHRARWQALAILPIAILLICVLVAEMRVMSVITGLAFFFFLLSLGRDYSQRPRWLRQQLFVQLEHGGRTISLGTWIASVESLGRERRRAYDSLARRLATATSEELETLTQDERRWLRARLKDEWPGEALQIALLLALGTAGDIFVKPYARRLVTNPDESETVREAAEECLRCLERAG